jgi:predicted small integral membrane protein
MLFILLGVFLVDLGANFEFVATSMSADVQFPNSDFPFAADATTSPPQNVR